MTGASETAPAEEPEVQVRWRRMLGFGLLGILALLALLVAFPPANLLRNHIARIVGDEIGRTVTIGGARLAFRPDIHIELENVTVSNPPDMAGPDLFRAGKAKAKVRLWPLIKGEPEIQSVDLVAPEFNLQVDAAGRNNWTIERKSAGSGGGLVLPHTATLENGRLSYVSAKTGSATAIDELTASATVDRTSGATQASGRFAFKRETLNFALAVENIETAADERPTNIKVSLDGRHLRAEAAGEALASDITTAFAGEVTASTASLLELTRWLGSDVTPSGEPLKSRLAGRIRATSGNVQFIATEIVVNQTSAILDGNLDLTGPRARLEGKLAAERIDVARVLGVAQRQAAQVRSLMPAEPEDTLVAESPWDSLLAEIERLEQGGEAPLARAAPQPAAPAAAAKPAWSEQPISFGALKVLDVDIVLTAKEIAYGGLDLKNGEFKTVLANGVLDAKVEKLDVGAGKAVGSIAIDSVASPPQIALALTMTDVAAEPIINEIAGKPLLAGTANVDIAAKAVGQNQNQLATTLEGKAKFRMGKGALRGYEIRGFDFWEMLTNWKTILKFDLAKRTPFERLDAQYDIKKGIMTSSPGLDVGGGQVAINSKGDVNLPRKQITQKLRVTVLPPPTEFSLPVTIAGDWAKPSVGIDWATWFTGIAPSGDLRSIAPAAAAPAPPEVQAAIRRLLAANIDPELLSEEGKAVLRALLPPESAPEPEPPAAEPPPAENVSPP